MALIEALLEISERPTSGQMVIEMMQALGPVWIAFLVGIMMGWAWRPRWASLNKCKCDFSAPSSPCALIPSPVRGFDSTLATPSFGSFVLNKGLEEENVLPAVDNSLCSTRVTDADLKYLRNLVERKDGGPTWKHMMDRSTHNMSYQAWQRDPETGPPQYCSKTVYEDASPELLRDFFWDDEFRLKWDNMLTHGSVLEECPTTGTMVVHWIRKFPFFCSDREYIIGRRIWESGKSYYYSVTKGVQCVSVPRKDKPKRVDLYYSSWYIQAVESRKRNGQLSACEVTLFHYEDMGIPWEIAKFWVRQGMWGTVKNIERGFRAYQKHRTSSSVALAPLSHHHAFMAQINTKIDPPKCLKVAEGDQDSKKETELVASSSPVEKPKGGVIVNIQRLLFVGGVIAVAASLDRGLFTKALVFGVAKRFGNVGRKESISQD